MDTLSREYSLAQAVSDGILLDMTAMAHEANLPYPTYVSTALWNGPDFASSEVRMKAVLEDCWLIRRHAEQKMFETKLYAVGPDMKKRAWPKAAFPRLAVINLTALPSETCSVILVLTCGYETLDLRAVRKGAGSFYTM